MSRTISPSIINQAVWRSSAAALSRLGATLGMSSLVLTGFGDAPECIIMLFWVWYKLSLYEWMRV